MISVSADGFLNAWNLEKRYIFFTTYLIRDKSQKYKNILTVVSFNDNLILGG